MCEICNGAPNCPCCSEDKTKCPMCDGTGFDEDGFACPECDESGFVDNEPDWDEIRDIKNGN